MSRRFYPIALLVVVLYMVSAASYLVSPQSEATESGPVRVLLPNKGGKVVFDHQVHAASYQLACDLCHHTGDMIACGECHTATSADDGILNRMDAFHQSCMGCHEETGAGPWEKDQCNQCHLK